MQRDSLDFKNMKISSLFFKQLFPTLLGMISSALFVVIDGIFVGQGIGSNGIAAVNITMPLFMIVTGLGLMFGMGGGILASINISRGKHKVANINVTQSTIAALTVSTLVAVAMMTLTPQLAVLLGSDALLLDQAVEYMFWVGTGMPAAALLASQLFFVRLTNPRFGMWAMIISTVINIVLDYVFIFVCEWGLFGAAIATVIGEYAGAIMLFIYLCRTKTAVRFAKLKLSYKSMKLTLRNIWYMARLGVSTCLSEMTISLMAISGNLVFMHYMGTDGVASFSIICYLFPVIFMVFNSIVQSAQPIISYNYGAAVMDRSNKALRLSLQSAVTFGITITLVFVWFASDIVSLFVPDKTNPAFQYAVSGLPLFATDYIFFGINVIIIGYYASIERVKRALGFTLLRGVLPVGFFILLPLLMGNTGIWLAVAASDITTTIVIIVFFLRDRAKRKRARRV